MKWSGNMKKGTLPKTTFYGRNEDEILEKITKSLIVVNADFEVGDIAIASLAHEESIIIVITDVNESALAGTCININKQFQYGYYSDKWTKSEFTKVL